METLEKIFLLKNVILMSDLNMFLWRILKEIPELALLYTLFIWFLDIHCFICVSEITASLYYQNISQPGMVARSVVCASDPSSTLRLTYALVENFYHL